MTTRRWLRSIERNANSTEPDSTELDHQIETLLEQINATGDEALIARVQAELDELDATWGRA